MNYLFLVALLLWFIYSSMAIYEVLYFSIYKNPEKFKAIATILLLPFLGAYLETQRMGYRLSQESKDDLKVETPWWVSINTPKDVHLDDD